MRVFSLDRPRIAEALLELVEARYRLDPRVVSVYLFGSFAWGIPAPGSDLDLLVIVEDDPRPARDRIPDYLPGAFPIAVDVLVWTRGEWEERLARGDRLARQVATQGRVLVTKPA